MNTYLCEKFRAGKSYKYTMQELKKALENGTILEGRAIKYTEDLNIKVDLGNNMVGTIPYAESEYSLNNAPIKSIALMTKVGKIVAFKVIRIEESTVGETEIILSRKQAQEECQHNYIDKLKPGEIIDAMVTHIETYGLFCDIGCGISAMLPLNNLSVTRVNNPKQVLEGLKDIKAVVKSKDEYGRLLLSHKELLGTWEQEAAAFKEGTTVVGKVRSIQDYGIFVELTPNLSALAEIGGDITVKQDQRVTVFIKSIVKSKMKIKLLLITGNDEDDTTESKVCPKYDYKITSGRLKHWVYSPSDCERVIETVFEDEFAE